MWISMESVPDHCLFYLLCKFAVSVHTLQSCKAYNVPTGSRLFMWKKKKSSMSSKHKKYGEWKPVLSCLPPWGVWGCCTPGCTKVYAHLHSFPPTPEQKKYITHLRNLEKMSEKWDGVPEKWDEMSWTIKYKSWREVSRNRPRDLKFVMDFITLRHQFQGCSILVT